MPSAEATVTVVSTNLAACSEIIDPRLASISQPDELGCATSAGQVVWAAWEEFERGYLLWRSDTDRAYAIFADGSWQTIDERWDNKAIPSRGNPPAGLQAPTRGFGYAWGVRDDLFSRLGWAKGGEKGFCALIQSFQHGFILKSDTTEFCQDRLYNQAHSPDWTPILFAATDTGQWREPSQ